MSSQFGRLYRIFLFRVIDPDLLSATGDPSRLLGQIAVIPVLLGVGFTLGAMGFGRGNSHEEMLRAAWGIEHALIATTMLVTGMLTVLSWESTFPDLKDLMVMGTLPVDASAVFFAKIAALGTAQATAIVALNAMPGLVWPLGLAPPSRNFLHLLLMPELYRTFVAFWVTMAGAGAFVFLSVVSAQAILAQLVRRRTYLRLSAWLQLACFCLFLAVYFIPPVPVTATALAADENRNLLRGAPSYWFLGLFQHLNGSAHPAMEPLAFRAVVWLAVVGGLAVGINLLTYRRRLRQIVEEPELSSRGSKQAWTPRLGFGIENAVFQFAWRTILHSRQHRLLLAFSVGAALSTVVLLIQSGGGRGLLSPLQQARTASASVIIAIAWIAGLRSASSLPVALKANWVFRITQIQPGHIYLAATRRCLLLMATVPPMVLTILVFLAIWPFRDALLHVAATGLWCIAAGYASLINLRRIPFTCSFRPAQAPIHMRLLAIMAGVVGIGQATAFEQRALSSGTGLMLLFGLLGSAALGLRLILLRVGREPEQIVEFEDEASLTIQHLGLYRDGVMAIRVSNDRAEEGNQTSE